MYFRGVLVIAVCFFFLDVPGDCLLRGSWSRRIVWKSSRSEIPDRNMAALPVVINTWGFSEATDKAWEVLEGNGNVLDAVEKGCTACEILQCDGTVGYGGSPDENGETTLDAMIMDGETHSIGAVACLRRIKSAVSVARKVMEHTKHTILAGELATEFAIKMGFREESLSTVQSIAMHEQWKNNSCQPNFWKNVQPDPSRNCGPYIASKTPTIRDENEKTRQTNRHNHDTIGMVAIDALGRVASAVSSNGAKNKIPGRVGDAPIPGAGSYVDKEVGGAAATGDGDVMMRFLPSLIAVERMREGDSPSVAAGKAIGKIVRFYPTFSGALVAVNLKGEYGAACSNIDGGFPFSVRNPESGKAIVHHVDCV